MIKNINKQKYQNAINHINNAKAKIIKGQKLETFELKEYTRNLILIEKYESKSNNKK